MDLAFSAQKCPAGRRAAPPGRRSRAAPGRCARGTRCARCGGSTRSAGNCFGCLSFQVVAVKEGERVERERENRRLLVAEWVFSINFFSLL